jgi:hypothetical protein
MYSDEKAMLRPAFINLPMEPQRNFLAANRRTFLKCGIGASAASAMIHRTSLEGAAVRYYKVVFDERFDAPRAFAAEVAARGIPTGAISGDITNLFFDDLDLRWKQGPVSLAGFTTPASLFCLDLLARDRGMRLTHCVTNPSVQEALTRLDDPPPHRSLTPSRNPSCLVFWIIAPRAHGAAKETANA